MKTTDNFKKAIEQELRFRAFKDPMLAQALRKKDKNIDDCVSYILTEVKNSGMNGFDDKEVFGMAIHYYSEDDLKVKPFETQGQVVVNRHVKLTEEEVEELKEKARKEVINEERAKMRKKPTKPVTAKDVEKQKGNDPQKALF